MVQLSGTLPAGKCLLVGGPQSSPDNGNASFAPSATFGLKLARAFGGVGLQNPANDVPDAVALFDVPASLVRRDRSPVDILVYHSSSTAQLSSPFKGLGTAATARVNVITGFDLGAGKSIRRLGLDRWEISGRVGSAEGGLPTPNACTAVGR